LSDTGAWARLTLSDKNRSGGAFAVYTSAVVQRSRVRASANATQQLFHRLVENAQDVVYRYRVAPPRGYDYINSACLPILGHAPEEFYADPDLALKSAHPDDRWIVREAFQANPKNLQLAIQLRWVHPDGKIVWADHRRVPILDGRGRLIAIEGVGRDITQSLTIQNRLRRSEGQLRRLAANLRSAREAERAHLSRELHDELGQLLTSLKMDLSRTVRDLLPLDLAPALIDRMQSMVGNIEVATETVRRLATNLRPPALDHLGLAAAIELEAAAVSRRTGLRCRVAGKLRASGTPEQATAVFRIVQEALMNVVRHAGASAVRIAMRDAPGQLSVKIHDNGRGITARELDDPGSIGLLGMRERAELIGGELSITGKRGKGTTILISAPVAREPRMRRA
jgi:two-component system sensor histidine kinase UhpB